MLILYCLHFSNWQKGAGLVQSYTSLADFQAKFNESAKTLGLNDSDSSTKDTAVWAPFTRKNTWNLDYVSIYDPTVDMDPAMWAPLYPGNGQECVHCGWNLCVDDSCGGTQKLQEKIYI